MDAGYTETVQRNRLAVTPDDARTLANGQFTNSLTGSGFDKTLRDEQKPINNKVFGRGGKNRIGENVFTYCLGSIHGAFTELYDYNFDAHFTASAGTIAYDNRGKASTQRFRVDSPDHLDSATEARIRFQNSTQDIHGHTSSVSTSLKIPVKLLELKTRRLRSG